jgi:hypothetical protein
VPFLSNHVGSYQDNAIRADQKTLFIICAVFTDHCSYLYDQSWPIWTHQIQTPPAKFVFDDGDRRGEAIDSMVSGGCVISGATIRHSLGI